jgi:hypothetical protein
LARRLCWSGRYRPGRRNTVSLTSAPRPRGRASTYFPTPRQTIILRVHARIGHEDRPAQFPTAQVVLDPGHRGDIDGIPRENPTPHRQPFPGHGQGHHHLGRSGPLFGMAKPS